MSNTVSREYIDQYGMTAEEYAKLTSEDQKALSASYVEELISEGLSSDEIETKLQELQDKINEVISEYQSELKELNSLENGDFSAETVAQQQALEKDLDTIIETLGEEIDNIKAADDDFKKHQIDFSDGGDVGALEPGTEEYVYDMSGNTSATDDNPFGDTTSGTVGDYTNSVLNGVVSQDDYNYLLDQNIINEKGEVITGTKTFAEIETALKTHEFEQDHTEVMMPTENASGSSVENITLLSTGDGNDYSFKIEYADGTSAIVTFKNVPDNAMFYFSAGIASADSVSGWPDDVLKQCTWGDGTSDVTDGLVTFYDSLHQTEYTDEQKRGVISGYTDVKEGYDSITKTYGTTTTTEEGTVNTTNVQTAYSDAVDILYDYLNDPTAKDIDEVWDEVYDKFADLGLSDADISAALQTLVLSIQTNDPDHFSTLFQGTAVTRIEASLVASQVSSTDTLTALDKLTIMVLEQFGAPGNYADLLTGGYFSSDGTTDGKWADHDENVWSLTQFNTICGNSAGGTLPEAVTFLDNEKEKAGITDTSGGGIKSSGYNADEGDAMTNMDTIKAYAKTYHANEFIDTDGTTESQAESALIDILPDIQKMWESGKTTAEIRKEILDKIGNLSGTNQDDVACLVVVMLMEHAPTLYKQLFTSDSDGETFRLALGAIIYNGGDVPSIIDPVNDGLHPFKPDLYNLFSDCQ